MAGKTLHGYVRQNGLLLQSVETLYHIREIEHFLREHATVTDGQDEKRYGKNSQQCTSYHVLCVGGVSEDVLEDIKG